MFVDFLSQCKRWHLGFCMSWVHRIPEHLARHSGKLLAGQWFWALQPSRNSSVAESVFRHFWKAGSSLNSVSDSQMIWYRQLWICAKTCVSRLKVGATFQKTTFVYPGPPDVLVHPFPSAPVAAHVLRTQFGKHHFEDLRFYFCLASFNIPWVFL